MHKNKRSINMIKLVPHVMSFKRENVYDFKK